MTIFGDVIRSGAAVGRRRPEVTTPNDSALPIYYASFFNCGSIFFRSEVIRLFRFGWIFPFTGPILGVFGEFGPLDFLHTNENPKRHFLAPNRVV
jgi:hypothetical protein